jgi:hypothetical protein
MREICTSGTVRGEDGNILTYSDRELRCIKTLRRVSLPPDIVRFAV